MKSPFIGKSTTEIARYTKVPARTINHIYATAISRGFKPNQPSVILDHHVKDLPCSGRPKKQTPEMLETTAATIRASKTSRALTCADLAGELSKLGIEASKETVRAALRGQGFNRVKSTKKPGLTATMRKKRYDWCMERKDWGLDD